MSDDPRRSATCDVCGYVAKTAQGLTLHRAHKHRAVFEEERAARGGEPRQRRERPVSDGGNAAAVEVTLGELERMGRLERVDAAAVQSLRSLAASVDLHPQNAALFREYREQLERMTESDDATPAERLLAEIRGAGDAEVGDAASS